MTVDLNSSLIVLIMLIERVYGDQYINLRQFKETNQIRYAVFLSIHMCLGPLITEVLLDRYKHIA